ncbi:MAG TPA: FxsA family protein [Hyphomonadaceae bacterium]|nr:FxsA family protein [Hyphomonadaceae bacterium]
MFIVGRKGNSITDADAMRQYRIEWDVGICRFFEAAVESRRYRGVMFRSLSTFFLLFVIAEMATLITMGRYLGLIPTLLIVIGGGIVGGWIARWQAVRAALRARSQLASGVMPTAEMTEGFLILLAAVLFIIPGILTDVLGLALLFPPTRALLRRAAVAQFSRHSALGWFVHRGGRPPHEERRAERDQIIDARVIESRVVEE